MRRSALLALLIVAAASAGWLVGNAPTAGAAPTYRWTPDEEEYYRTWGPVFHDYVDAMQMAVTAELPEDHMEPLDEAGRELVELAPPVRLTAVHDMTHWALFECSNTIAYMSGLTDDDWNVMASATYVAMRNNCMQAMHDARAELARFAALNGGWPPAEDVE
jgi:hypothetical protein